MSNESKRLDLTWKQFGCLTALRDVGSDEVTGKKRGRLWECLCKCGSLVRQRASFLTYRGKTDPPKFCRHCRPMPKAHLENLWARTAMRKRWQAYGMLYTNRDEAKMVRDVEAQLVEEFGPVRPMELPGLEWDPLWLQRTGALEEPEYSRGGW